ncbi:MAG: hypothetical protein PVG26_23500 [Desulfobacterales bacterium]|jgi:hypothetical protein
MKEKIRQRIVENNGKIIAENDKLIEAEFSYDEMEKAIRVLFDLTQQMNQNAVLRGGNRLSVYNP